MAPESWDALGAFAPLFDAAARDGWSPDDSLSQSDTGMHDDVFDHYAPAAKRICSDPNLVSPTMLVDHLRHEAPPSAAMQPLDVPRAKSGGVRKTIREIEARLDALAYNIQAIMAIAAVSPASAPNGASCIAMPTRTAIETACAPVFSQHHTPPEGHMRAIVQALIASTPGCSMAAGRALLSDVRCWFRKRREAAGVRLQNHVRRTGSDPRALLDAMDTGRLDLAGVVRGSRIPPWREDVLVLFVRQKLASMCQRAP